MAEEKASASYQDMLDIIFSGRNKAYGAYQLRRSYPAYLGRALLYGLVLIGLLFALPYITKSVSGAFAKKEKPIEVTAELGAPPDINPDEPPPPPPPPPPTPPPPTRTTQKFVPPVIKKDNEVTEQQIQEVDKLIKDDKEIGKEDKKGNDNAAPALNQNPDVGDLFQEPAKKQEPEKTFELYDVQKEPSFPGGEAELFKFLRDNIKYPPMARDNNIQGQVVLSFVVNKDGSISDVVALRELGGGCTKEAVRVVSTMPKWSPGEANGHAVKVKYTLPVRFELQ